MAFSAGRPCRNVKCVGTTKTSNPYCPGCADSIKQRQLSKADAGKFANNKYGDNTDTNKQHGKQHNGIGVAGNAEGSKLAGTPKRPSAYRRGYDTKWRKLSKWFLQQNPWCVACGNPADHTDHKLPLSKGGSNDLNNLQSLCHRCHSKKTIKEFDGA